MLDYSVAAVSASDTITDLGAYAGIAAILGLAVLSVLMFAQARELKRLREWAGRAPERAAEMQERLQADAQRRVVPQPVPVTRTPAASPATPAAAAVAAAAAKSPPAPGASPPAGVTGAVAAGAQAGKPAAPNAAAVPDDATQAIPVVPASAAPAPRPTTGPALRPASAAALPSLHRGEAENPPSHARTTLAVVGGLVGTLAIAFVLITQVFGGDDDPASTADRTRTASVKTATTTPGTTATGVPARPAIAKVVRGDFKVFVLNSTDRNGAAREAANKLKSSGFEIQGTGQAVTQTMDITQVAYKEGSKRAALEVAMLLEVSPADVILANQDTLVAGGMANVVVTLGADKVK